MQVRFDVSGAMVGAMIRTAQLRVYLEETAGAVRGLPESPSQLRVPVEVGVGLTTERVGDDAYTTEWQGSVYRCPRTPRIRMLEGLLALRAASSQLGPFPLFSQRTADDAHRQLEQLKEVSSAGSHILTSAWHVPMRWFVPFDPVSRELVDAGGLTIRYRQLVSDGLGRLDLAIDILEVSDIPEAIIDEVDQLRVWLRAFPPSAMVELDYGSVARFFDPADLAVDDSVGDLWAAVLAVAVDDWDTAGDRYGTLVERWAIPTAVSYSN